MLRALQVAPPSGPAQDADMADSKEDPLPSGDENNTPEAPPSRPAPLQDREKMDVGCLLLLMAAFAGIFCLPALFLLGGAPAILPLLTLLLVALVTPFINPAERMEPRAKWTGRLLTFLGLALLLAAGWYWFFQRAEPILLE